MRSIWKRLPVRQLTVSQCRSFGRLSKPIPLTRALRCSQPKLTQLTFRPFSSGIKNFDLADIGEGITEVEVLQWFVQPGDTINEFDRVCEVQSDKAAVEITSRYAGVVESVCYEVGDIAFVGKPLIKIRDGSASPQEVMPEPTPTLEPTPAPEPTPAHVPTASSSSGETDFNLADIGEGIKEVEVLQWFVNVGDSIQEFDRVCEVQSDKASVEITSRFSGVVTQICHEVGGMAQVGQPLMKISVAGQETGAPSSPPSATPQASQAQATPSGFTQNASGKVLCSPAVRRMAREHQIDLAAIPGTGPAGRILKEDVQNYLANPGAAPVRTTTPTPVHTPTPTPQPIAAPPSSTPNKKFVPPPSMVELSHSTRRTEYLVEDSEIKIRGLQRIMVQTMDASNKIPTLGYCEEINMDALADFRAMVNPHVASYGLKLSYLPFILKATSLALRQYPVLNATVSPDCSTITHRADHNIGVAVDTPRGLVVPVIKHVQHLTLLQIAQELKRLSSAALDGSLHLEDLQGGTFSLSNIGSIGGTYASPLIVTPQVCIGALGKMTTVPRYDAKMNIVPTRIMTASWSADHRVIEGAVMARFVDEWKTYLEDPQSMLLYCK